MGADASKTLRPGFPRENHTTVLSYFCGLMSADDVSLMPKMGYDPEREGRTTTPEAPRRVARIRSYPLLDFFTPSTPMCRRRCFSPFVTLAWV